MPAKTRLHVIASRTHKWLAIIIGIQLLLWFASGAVMSFFPIDEVHGDHLVNRQRVEALDPGAIVAQPGAFGAKPIESLTFRMLLDRPVAEVTSAGAVTLYDAASGQPIGPVSAATAQEVARKAWLGAPGTQATTDTVTAKSTEYRGPVPAWRVAFADPDHTRVFVDQATGRITAVRTGTWRLYDFFWGLHIMDWKNHENFNSPWLLGFAIGGLVLWLGGAVLLYFRWPRRRRRRS